LIERPFSMLGSQFMRSNISVLKTLRELGIIEFIVKELRQREIVSDMGHDVGHEDKGATKESNTEPSSTKVEDAVTSTKSVMSCEAPPSPEDARFWNEFALHLPSFEEAESSEDGAAKDILKDGSAEETAAKDMLQEKQMRDRQYLKNYWKNLNQVVSFCRVLYQVLNFPMRDPMKMAFMLCNNMCCLHFHCLIMSLSRDDEHTCTILSKSSSASGTGKSGALRSGLRP
jgi:hypothetical protein